MATYERNHDDHGRRFPIQERVNVRERRGYRDILLGDIISGSLRLVEAILMAAVLALGMMAAIWLMGGIA